MTALPTRSLFSGQTLIIVLINALICTLVAVVLWVLVPELARNNFINGWIFSQCIGQSICLLFLLFGHFVRRSEKLQSARWLVLAHPIFIVVGFMFGSWLARLLLGLQVNVIVERNDILVSLVITIVVSVLSSWFYFTREQLTSLRLAAAEEAKQASQARLAMLQAQLEPHMLFNTLANLRTLVAVDPLRAQLMLDQLIDFLRATLDGSQASHTTLQAEFETLKNYLALMQVRLGDRLHTGFELPASLSNVSVPTLLLQPVVENAVVHGIEPSMSGGSIIVCARSLLSSVAAQDGDAITALAAKTDELQPRVLELKVIDTGVGMSPNSGHALPRDPRSSTSGFGLQGLRDRLSATGLDDNSLQIISPPTDYLTGTQVVVKLPITVAASADSNDQNLATDDTMVNRVGAVVHQDE